jgi:hypothetical protein
VDGVPLTVEAVEFDQVHSSEDLDGQPIEGGGDVEEEENEDVDGAPLSVPVASILAATGMTTKDDEEEGARWHLVFRHCSFCVC